MNRHVCTKQPNCKIFDYERPFLPSLAMCFSSKVVHKLLTRKIFHHFRVDVIFNGQIQLSAPCYCKVSVSLSSQI